MHESLAMYTRILVPTDGSSCSDRAIAEAVRLAKSLGAEMTALCAVDALSVIRDGMVDARAIVDRMRDEARQAVEHAEDVARGAGLVARGEVVEGKPAEEIVREARRFDLVVMASHGKGLVKRLVLGSVVQAVLLRIDRPVLVVNCSVHGAPPSE